MALYNSYSSATDPGVGRDATQFYAFDAKSHADAINTNTSTFPQSGTFASRPAAALVGRLYFAQDNDTLYRDNGATWDLVRIGSDSCDAMGAVPSAGWTAVNMQSGAAWAADKDAMLFTIPSVGSAGNVQYQYRAYPTPPFVLTTYLDFTQNPTTSASAFGGIIVSDGTKIITAGASYGNGSVGSLAAGWNVWAGKYSNATTYSAIYGGWPMSFVGTPRWYRFSDNATTITLQCSVNGMDWVTLGSEARTTFLTPTRIGLGGSNYVGQTMLMRVRSWNGVA